jgi:hypothetical protein
LKGAALLGELGRPLGRLGRPGLWLRLGDLAASGGAGLGGAERLDLFVGVAAAEFGVGGDGQAARPGGDRSQARRSSIASSSLASIRR